MYVVLLVLLILVILSFLYLTDRLPFAHQPPIEQPTNNSYTKGEPSGSSQQSGSSSSSNNQDSKGNDGSNATFIAPTGDFVSNHHPSLSNNPSGSGYLTSTCSTTPGATCQITFTKDGVTKSLAVEVTDAGGAAYWNNWQPSDIGLTQGSWTITAVAKLGSQTLTANDALQLEVEP
jgi:hypothetical protein